MLQIIKVLKLSQALLLRQRPLEKANLISYKRFAFYLFRIDHWGVAFSYLVRWQIPTDLLSIYFKVLSHELANGFFIV